MRRSLVSLGFLVVLVFAPVRPAAQGLTVDYIEGSASQRTTEAWAVLSVGDAVPLEGSVKLERHSLVQLKAPGAMITLSQPGTYVIRRLLAARASLRDAGAAQAIAAAFSRIRQGSPERTDEAGGIRAEKMPPDRVELEQVNTPARGEVPGQAQVDSDTREARFSLAMAYSLSGDARRGLEALSGVVPAETDDWAPDFLLLRAKLLVDTFAFTEAAELLLKLGAGLAADRERAPTYFFLLALAYRGSGDAVRQDLCLDKVVSLAEGSELGTAAARLRGMP